MTPLAQAAPAPLPLRAAPRASVFWNWELVLACNYRCTYCNYTALGWNEHSHMNAFPGMKRLAAVWARVHSLYGACHIELSGGEPSAYPAFHNLMGMLTDLHTVTMDTNLSFDAERFAARVNLKRVRLAASFHPEFAQPGPFLEKCLFLREKGVSHLCVNYVAYPDHLREMASLRRSIKAAGIPCFVQPFQGVYKKRTVYPAGYTAEEMSLIESTWRDKDPDTETSRHRFQWKGHALTSGVENQLRKIAEGARDERAAAPPAEAPKRWRLPFPGAGYEARPAEPSAPRQKGTKSPVLCRMGQRYAKTYASGDTFRCCAQVREDMVCDVFLEKVYLGNLFYDDHFRLLEEASWCDYEPCPCDRCMVVGEESRWEHRWNTPEG